MTGQKIGQHIQSAFDWMREMVEPIENRWITLSVVVFLYLILRAVGAHGVGEIITVIYIMYWVTLRGPHRERDE
jgi:hypothetical protein